MIEGSNLIDELSTNYQNHFQKQKVIISFGEFLEMVQENPDKYLRNAADYITDSFDHFGTRPSDSSNDASPIRYKIFDLGTERNGPIIGGEHVQSEIKSILSSFVQQGHSSKLILLHGPNGSAKTSTVETISRAMQNYSKSDDGAVYRFNWIFPSDKSAGPTRKGESGPIGFGTGSDKSAEPGQSYALLDESKISSRIGSEFKENPIFLIPTSQRIKWLKQWVAKKNNCEESEITLPRHILLPGLSKRNHAIFESLLNAYEGNLAEVFRHIQIERFYYSRQYHIGISAVEPQMSIDAREKQLTLDKNMSNLPSILNTINFYLSEGEIVEANRGLLEFSDLLKRPVEAFKYLLATIEKSSVNLPSGTANLDIVFIGTTNDKHLDSFKTSPDFGSFKGRFELVTVPYLLSPSLEMDIYKPDVIAAEKTTKISPHALEYLCTWSVMTRLKQPEPELYEKNHRSLIAKLDPRSKAMLYNSNNNDLKEKFGINDAKQLRTLRERIMSESKGMVVYEGRFGASPREIRAIIHKAANGKHKTLTPMTVFSELKKLVKDRTVYEFLQFEPRGKYHNASAFIDILEEEFALVFERECVAAMKLVDESEYETMVRRYVDHIVAEIKNEKIWDAATNSHIPPSNAVMTQVETIMGIKSEVKEHREGILSRIAGYKIENPKKPTDVTIIFDDMIRDIKKHFYNEKKSVVDTILRSMALIDSKDHGLSQQEIKAAEATFKTLETEHGYDFQSAKDCLCFLLNKKKLAES